MIKLIKEVNEKVRELKTETIRKEITNRIKKTNGQVVVHGNIVKGELLQSTDLDGQGCLYLLEKEIGIKIVPIFVSPGKFKEGFVNVDTGGCLQFDGDTIILDHHFKGGEKSATRSIAKALGVELQYQDLLEAIDKIDTFDVEDGCFLQPSFAYVNPEYKTLELLMECCNRTAWSLPKTHPLYMEAEENFRRTLIEENFVAHLMTYDDLKIAIHSSDGWYPHLCGLLYQKGNDIVVSVTPNKSYTVTINPKSIHLDLAKEIVAKATFPEYAYRHPSGQMVICRGKVGEPAPTSINNDITYTIDSLLK